MVRMGFGDISYCCYWTALPGLDWVLLNYVLQTILGPLASALNMRNILLALLLLMHVFGCLSNFKY